MIVGVVGAVVAAMVVWPNTADETYTKATPVRGGPTGPPPLPEFVPLVGKRKDEALATARTFIRTAVARKDVGRSWAITHPDFRQGYTREQWETGDIPVVPYPVDVARWRLGSTTVEGVAFEVLLLPVAGASVSPQMFDIQLAELDSGGKTHWAVTSWAPRAGGIAQQPPESPESPERQAVAAGSEERFEPVLGAVWLIVPAVLLAGFVLAIPAFLLSRDWRRRRRGNRLYREHAAARAADHADEDGG